MPENKCSVCNEKFEDQYFDKNQNKCILHSKKTIKELPKKEVENFWKVINNKIKQVNNVWKESSELISSFKSDTLNDNFFKYKFEKISFPPFITDGEYDKQSFFNLEKIDLEFKECTFSNEFDFRFLQKAKSISFYDCIFDDIVCSNYSFDYDFVINKSWVKSNADFSNTSFKQKFDVSHTRFKGKTKFRNINFLNFSLFNFSRFYKKVDFSFSIFENNVSFIESEFYKKSVFLLAVFNKNVSFNNSKFETLDLARTSFLGFVDFVGITNIQNERFSRFNISNRDTARNLKHQLEKIGNHIDSNLFYKIEMDFRKKELAGKNFFEHIVFLFHSMSSNYSQNWILALFWIFIIGMFASYLKIEDSFVSPMFYNGFGKELTLAIEVTVLTYLTLYNLVRGSKFTYILWIFISSLFIYWNLTEDIYLNHFAKVINPFNNGKDLTSLSLLFKLLLGYLAYQFIVSIRQNTRRK